MSERKDQSLKLIFPQSIVEHKENLERLKQLFGQIPNRGMFIEAMMNEGPQVCFLVAASLANNPAAQTFLAVIYHG